MNLNASFIVFFVCLLMCLTAQSAPQVSKAGINKLNENLSELNEAMVPRLKGEIEKQLESFGVEQELNVDESIHQLGDKLLALKGELDKRACRAVLDAATNLVISQIDFAQVIHEAFDPVAALNPKKIFENITDNSGRILDPGNLRGLFKTQSSLVVKDESPSGIKVSLSVMLMMGVISENEYSGLFEFVDALDPTKRYDFSYSTSDGLYISEHGSNNFFGSDAVIDEGGNKSALICRRHGQSKLAWELMKEISELSFKATVKIKNDSTRELSLVGFENAPQLVYSDSETLDMRIPGVGSWGIEIPLEVGFKRVDIDPVPITIKLVNFNINSSLGIRGHDSGKIDFTFANSPYIDFDIELEDSRLKDLGVNLSVDMIQALQVLENAVAKALVFALSGASDAFLPLSPVINLYADMAINTDFSIEAQKRKKLDDLMADVNTSMQNLVKQDLEPIGIPKEPKSQPRVPHLESIVKNIDSKIIEQHLSHGVITRLEFDDVGSDSQESWIDAFSPGGPGNPGSPVMSSCEVTSSSGTSTLLALKDISVHDSTIWTGLHLAAMAFRFKVLHDTVSESYLKQTLRAVERLFEINDNTGLLARATAKKDSPLGRRLQCLNAEGSPKFVNEREIDGEVWVGLQADGITRDPYVGVMFGLYTTYLYTNDPEVRRRASAKIQLILDYLIGNKWLISDDRPDAKIAPQNWAFASSQRIAFLTVAESVAPGKYTKALNSESQLLDTMWFTYGFSSIDPIFKFYGNNLAYTTTALYVLAEKDQSRLDQFLQGIRVKDYYFGHHNNAYFNLVRSFYAEQGARYKLIHSSKDILIQYMSRRHRDYIDTAALGVDGLNDLSGVETIPVSIPLQNSQEFGDVTLLPKYPLDPQNRRLETFIWQNSSFEPARKKQQKEEIENIGSDISLAYWMLRDREASELAWLVPVLHLLLN